MRDDGMRRFRSRLVDSLNLRIQQSPSPVERRVLSAQLAAALARHALVPESKGIIRDLRGIRPGHEPRLSAWIMFAEGVIAHAEAIDPSRSQDRILRAHLVGQAANDPGLAGTAAAWLAGFAFVQGRHLESAGYLELAWAWSGAQDHGARAMASMVLGEAMAFMDAPERARVWLRAARSHAVACGDIAMQAMVLLKSAAVQVGRLGLLDCIGPVDPAELRFASLSLQSSGNLQTALGMADPLSVISARRAELLAIERHWPAAVQALDAHIETARVRGISAGASKPLALRAWCKCHLGDLAGSRSDLASALHALDGNMGAQPLAVLHLRLAGTAAQLGNAGLAAHHREIGRGHLQSHARQQATVSSLFTAMADRDPAPRKNPA